MERFLSDNTGDRDPAEPQAEDGVLAWLRQAHAEQLTLCDVLEDIADSLPGNIDRQKCLYAAKALGPLILGMHHYEENVLFPWLARRLDTEFPRIRERLSFEHCEDACFAEELTDLLLRLGSGSADVNMEAAGYMLRGFFAGLRRHIAFEREFLIERLATGRGEAPPHG